MPIFSCNNLAKRYDDKYLFNNISFGLDFGERIGIIGKNGIGKSTLLQIISSKNFPDEGNVVFNNDVSIEYLPQIPDFDSEEIVIETVLNSNQQIIRLLNNHKLLCEQINTNYDESIQKKLDIITNQIESLNAWQYENEAKKILSMLGVIDLYVPINTLSGGIKKRVALARALLSNPDLLILDEPTNHLDADSVQWLQDRLQNSTKSLLLVTHDRYFLDACSTKIVEIDQNRIFSFPGSYETYLERKEGILANQESTNIHLRSKLRTELAWLQKGARARRTKQKSRIDWITKMQVDDKPIDEKKIKIELGKINLGGRIIDAHYISKKIANKILFKDFVYIAKPGDRIGIIGPNGCGKSTLLKVLAGELNPDSGSCKIGLNTKIGFFRQEIDELNPSNTVIGCLKEISEYIDTGVGRDRYLTNKDLLNKFMFPNHQHTSLISTLSGGEKRRLMLLRVLMANPNTLFLDEPTNDLDINTLSAIEEYLDDFYGVLIVVSHDRAFLDRTVNFILAFDTDGNIKEYPGNYSYYLEKKEQEAREKSNLNKEKSNKKIISKSNTLKKKFSYHEQKEFDKLEHEIPKLELQKKELEDLLYSGKITDYKEIERLSLEFEELQLIIDNSLNRWMELSDSIEK